MPLDLNGNKIYNSSIGPKGEVIKHLETNGLVYHLDPRNLNSYSGTGTTWNDLSGNSNTSTLINGPSYSSNYGSGSLYFDGSNDRAESVDSTSLSITTYLTIIAWIHPTAAVNSCGFVVKGSYNVYDWDYMLYLSSNSQAVVGYIKNSGGQPQAVGGYNPPTGMLNKWNHVVLTINGGTSAGLYVNGTQGASTAFPAGIRDSGVPLTIGYGYNNAFAGYIGSVRIYSTAFTNTQVTADYNTTKGRYGL